MTKTAIVIGVGPLNGLGGQLSLRFAKQGLHVFVAGRTQQKLDAVVAEIEAQGGRATAHVADATSEADIDALFATAGETLDLAIYNAGNNTPGRIADMDADYFESASLLFRWFSLRQGCSQHICRQRRHSFVHWRECLSAWPC